MYLTKGDNNNVDDRYDRLNANVLAAGLTVYCSGLYAHGQSWLQREDIVGVARAYVALSMGTLTVAMADRLCCCRSVPYVGMLTILLNDYPMLKYVLVGGMAVLVLTQRE